MKKKQYEKIAEKVRDTRPRLLGIDTVGGVLETAGGKSTY